MRTLIACLALPFLAQAESPPYDDSPDGFAAVLTPFCIEPEVAPPGPQLLDPSAAPEYEVNPDLVGDYDLGAAHQPIVHGTPSTGQLVARTPEPDPEPTRDLVAKETVAYTTKSQQTAQLAPSYTLLVTDERSRTTTRQLVAVGGVNADACIDAAYDSLPFELPSNTPPVNFPPIHGCDADQCVDVRRAWILAHHHAWQAARVASWMTASSQSAREWAWDRRGVDEDGGEVDTETSLQDWFGDYADYKYDAVIEVLHKQWRIFQTLESGGVALDNRCQDALVAQCNSVGHHLVKGQIAFCDPFFGEFGNDQEIQTQSALHEPLHHVWVGWREGILPRFSPLKDTWYHRHGLLCILGSLEYMVSDSECKHLAHYDNGHGNDCGHHNQAFRNIQNYTRYSQSLGRAVAQGDVFAWPDLGIPAPTPPSPDNCPPGDPGCTCHELYESGDYSLPDGDFQIDRMCYDNQGLATCVDTEFGAGWSEGICTFCEEGAAGCPCEVDEDCGDNLFCYGSDTANGYGVGTCYTASPPSWVCLADCQTLFNDELAWCFHEDLLGGTCYDSGCTKFQADACREEGAKCRDGVCLTTACTAQELAAGVPTCLECQNQADCTALGYPGIFECIAHQCRRPDWLE